MAEYDSDSSGGGDDIETNVLLGYASKEPTGDDFSQLGGQPTWLESKTTPSGSLQKCKVCNETMCLLLQLNGDLPDRFPGHERRLYVFGCKRKPCRRRNGSLRAFRAIRTTNMENLTKGNKARSGGNANASPAIKLGDALFGVKAPPSNSNPFASMTSSTSSTNPFSSSKPSDSPESITTTAASADSFSETFARKARISADNETPAAIPSPKVSEPWVEDTNPYPAYHLDADKEYLTPASESDVVPSNARLDNNGESSSAAEEKAAFESAMDKTFQRFADRLAQNPEQVLRYEFAGQPLLYSKTDAIGKQLVQSPESKVQMIASKNGTASALKVPRCTSCGAGRVFELQLTPHAITELEADEMSIDGMDWGTVIVGTCSEDCQEQGKVNGEVGYVEEWVGVQWEEITDHKKR